MVAGHWRIAEHLGHVRSNIFIGFFLSPHSSMSFATTRLSSDTVRCHRRRARVVFTFAIRFGKEPYIGDFVPIDVLVSILICQGTKAADPWCGDHRRSCNRHDSLSSSGWVPTLAASCAVESVSFCCGSISGLEPLYSGLLGFVAGAAIGFPPARLRLVLHLRLQRRWGRYLRSSWAGRSVSHVAAGSVFVTDHIRERICFGAGAEKSALFRAAC